MIPTPCEGEGRWVDCRERHGRCAPRQKCRPAFSRACPPRLAQAALAALASTLLISAAAFADPPTTRPAASHLTPRQVLNNFQRAAAGQAPVVPDPNAAPEEDLGEDPLGTVTDKMTVVQGDLTQLQTGKPVQDKEKNIIDDLNQMIAQLEPPGGGDGSNGGNIPDGGRKKSTIVSGDPTGGALHGIDPRAQQWTKLPPKQRGAILQSRTEGFPAGYEAILQSYYQHLAEEKPADEKPATPAKP